MKITWEAKDVIIKEMSLRTCRNDRTREEEDYLVLKFFQNKAETRTCMCFNRRLQKLVGIGLCCHLSGEVSFGMGSTYLVLTHVVAPGDQAQFDGR